MSCIMCKIIRDMWRRVINYNGEIFTSGDHLQDLVLLNHLSRNVEEEILGVHDTVHKVEIVGAEILDRLSLT